MAHRLNTNKQFMIGNGILAFAIIIVVVIFVYMSLRLSWREEDRNFREVYSIVLEEGFEGRATSVYLNDSLLMDSLVTTIPLKVEVTRFADVNALMVVDNATEQVAIFELSEQGGTYRFERTEGEVKLLGRKE